MDRLIDLGENRIVSELVGRYLGAVSGEIELGVGDDAAVIASSDPSQRMVITIDACPTPVVDILRVGSWRDWGRLAGVISLSDLAAMGARPVAMLSATSMPKEMLSADYEDFLEGLHNICCEYSTPIVGGNIREAKTFAATTVAIGRPIAGETLSRGGARVGDNLIVIGTAGTFWSAVLDVLSGINISALSELQFNALYRPAPKIDAIREILADGCRVHAAIDCSDGLGGAIRELCASSKVGVDIDFDHIPIPEEVRGSAARWEIPVENLMLAWGDWQLLISVSNDRMKRVMELLGDVNCNAFVVGTVTLTQSMLGRKADWREPRICDDAMASVRFENSSYLTAGLGSYIKRLQFRDAWRDS